MSPLDNIGGLRYTLAIIMGKNYQRSKATLKGKPLEGDIVVTINKKVLIVTSDSSGQRRPMIVKQWRQTDVRDLPVSIFETGTLQQFRDTDNRKWTFTTDGNVGILTSFGDDGEALYEFSIHRGGHMSE